MNGRPWKRPVHPKGSSDVDIRDYRKALGSFPTGVTIVTVFDDQGDPWGLTANSFTSVSLEPPVISVCVAKAGRVFPVLQNSTRFAVNILSSGQQDLAMHFASRAENRFTGIEWEANETGSPLFKDASARLDCSVFKRVDAEDHEILLGRVEKYDYSPLPPLTFCRGSFFAAPQTEQI